MHRKLLIASLIVLALALSACGGGAAEESAADDGVLKVAVAFPGVVTDQSWNQFGYEGLVQAQEDCGAEIAYSEDVFQDEQLETFRNYAAEGYDIIIGHGGEYADSIQQVAGEYPDLTFGITNSPSNGDNVAGMIMGANQQAFLSGVLACYMTESNHIAYIGGESIPVVEEAFKQYEVGAQLCGKDVQVDAVYTGSWADVNLAYEATTAVIEDGADVIAHLLDTADAGAIAAAEDSGVYAIGLYRDSSDLGPDAVIGSALGSPGALIYGIACGSVAPGTTDWLTVNTEVGGIGMHMTDLTPDDVQAEVDAVVDQMKSGEIEVLNLGQE